MNLPIEGILPPDLQGTLLRIGPGGAERGALHAIELRDGAAVSYLTGDTSADTNVAWHAGSVLALAEAGIPEQFSRALVPEEFGGALTVPIASHVHRDARTGGRVIFGIDDGAETTLLRIGEWDSGGVLTHHMAVTLERATWQHDIGLTERHIVFIESPTEPLPAVVGRAGVGTVAGGTVAVPFRWAPGAPGWVGVVARGSDGSTVRWFRLDPCLVTHVLGAYDDGDSVVLYVCRYEVPEKGQAVNLGASVVAPDGIGMSLIGGGLPVLERWRISGERLERVQVDERSIEYPRIDPLCEGSEFRYGYCAALSATKDQSADRAVDQVGLMRFDLARDEVATWNPGQHLTASEPLFVRAVDGHSDDEGWLLTVVDDAMRQGSDLYVLDASSFGRQGPQAVIHLPEAVRLPFRSHGEWVGADRYR